MTSVDVRLSLPTRNMSITGIQCVYSAHVVKSVADGAM